MPRSFYPRRAVVAAPVSAQMEQYISQWSDVSYTGAGSVAYRIVGVAPIDGELVGVTFIPDRDLTPTATKRWRIHVLNRGEGGTGTTAMTDVYETSAALTACVPVTFTLHENTNHLVVTAGEVIAWRAVMQIDAGAADTNPSARPSGVLILNFINATGS